MENKGTLVQIIGPVVDVKFTGELPKIYNALKIENKTTGKTIIAEVQQHLGNNTVRAVAMEATDGLVRGLDVVDTGKAISVPVGRNIIGRILNVLGEPVDEMGEIKADEYNPIHRAAPAFEEQSVETEILETGIKVIDLLAPYVKGGKVGLFGGAGVVPVSSLDFVSNVTYFKNLSVTVSPIIYVFKNSLSRRNNAYKRTLLASRWIQLNLQLY